jgi:isopenicillin N synthase-like dioxygenase
VIAYTPPSAAKKIPVIDFAGPNVAWEVHKACRETGFFYVANHGVPQKLVEAQFDWARRFFALPLEEKMGHHMKRSPSTAGYEPAATQVLDSQDAASAKAPPDLKEGFYYGMELSDDHPWTQKKIRGFGHNQWPAALPGFREQMLAYQAALRGLGDKVLAKLAESLELPQDFFVAYYDMPNTTLGLLRYRPHPENARPNQLGAGAHTDWGAITLLAQDELGGLEVRNVEEEWIEAPPVPGTFVVNLGDLMQRWTNALYRSNMHRVKNRSSTRERFSIPFFYGPRPDSRIDCLPGCCDGTNPPKYPPCTAAEHNYEMFRRSYGYDPRKPA